MDGNKVKITIKDLINVDDNFIREKYKKYEMNNSYEYFDVYIANL